jgi:putative ABC transport system permease protein
MFRDLKFAIRQLRKTPAFTVTSLLILAIGIGANTAIFSVMDAIVLRPLAVPDMNRVVTVYDSQNRTGDYPATAIGKYEDWVRQSHSFEELAIRSNRSVTLTGSGDATRVDATDVSFNFFHLLRIQPLMGRLFSPEETQPGRESEVVLSYGFWQRHLGGAPDVVGQRLELNGRATAVIGVLPRNSGYPSQAELFLPLAATPQQKNDRAGHSYFVIGRLKRGVTLQSAQAEMDAITTRLTKLHPATDPGWLVSVTPLLDNINGSLTPLYMRMIMAATVFVLLIVCANLANLQFARGLGRRNEMAVRTALGAQRSRLLRQLLIESVLLGLAGAAAGLVLAKVDLALLIAHMPPLIARYVAGWNHISLNGRVLSVSLILAVGAGVISGIAPAFESLRLDIVNQLKAGSRTATGSRRTHRLRNIFIVAQIAFAVALVIGAALMAKGLDAMFHRSDAYGPSRVLTFNVDLPDQRYGTPQRQAAWYDESLAKIRSLPGVRAAVITTALPEGNEGTWNDTFRVDNHPFVPGQIQTAARLAVSVGFFNTLHVPLREGRTFTGSDTLDATPVAIVSRNFAARYIPGTDALGHKLRLGHAKEKEGQEITIIGVVDNVRYQWTDDAPVPTIYLNAAQLPPAGAKYLVLTEGDPLVVAPAIRHALWALDPAMPLDAMQSYAEYIREGLVGLSQATAMLLVNAAIALLLTCIGMFGVMANLVGERRREIGVRLTMGATRENVVRLFLRHAAILLGIGLAIGIPMAAGLARVVANLLYGVNPGDIAVFASISIVIAAMTLLAAYLPARRIARSEPVDALRSE